MDFSLSEEQRLLRDSAERFVADNYPFSARQDLIFSQRGYSDKHWQLFAEMGWLGLPFEEQYGGFGGSAVDTAVVMEALGRGLALEPQSRFDPADIETSVKKNRQRLYLEWPKVCGLPGALCRQDYCLGPKPRLRAWARGCLPVHSGSGFAPQLSAHWIGPSVRYAPRRLVP